jgi:hypothetical protein
VADREDLDLFSASIMDGLDLLRHRLTTLAGELARKSGRGGVTASDLRIAATNKGWLTGEESEARMKALNLGATFAAAGLVASDRFRRSDVPRARRNLNRVWTLPEFAPIDQPKAGAA